MSDWQKLVETAIVGTAQKEPRRDFAWAEKFASGDKETDLLRFASVQSLRQKAGKVLQNNTEALPPVAAAETLQPLTKRQQEIFRQLVHDSDKQELCHELFRLMKERRKFIPHDMLDLIGASLNIHASLGQKHEIIKLILPLLGNRARWHARHYTGREIVFLADDPEKFWAEGKAGERLLALDLVRETDPARARAMLESTWAGESAKDRQQFLEILELNLSDADEPFLNGVLKNDKSREARQTALSLLASLPQSALVKEATERAEQILRWKQGGILSRAALNVDFPADFDALEKNDVLENVVLHINEKKLGRKAAKLAKLLSLAPPSSWQKAFTPYISEILKAARKSEWANALLMGFGTAAERFSDTAWLLELLNTTIKGEASVFCLYPNHLPYGVNQQAFAPLSLAYLQSGPAQFINWVNSQPAGWDAGLERQMIEKLELWLGMAIKGQSRVSLWELYNFAHNLALKIGPENLPVLGESIERAYRAEGRLPERLQRTQELLRLRQEMREAFANEE
jgi:hypothetical protein